MQRWGGCLLPTHLSEGLSSHSGSPLTTKRVSSHFPLLYKHLFSYWVFEHSFTHCHHMPWALDSLYRTNPSPPFSAPVLILDPFSQSPVGWGKHGIQRSNKPSLVSTCSYWALCWARDFPLLKEVTVCPGFACRGIIEGVETVHVWVKWGHICNVPGYYLHFARGNLRGWWLFPRL